MNQEELESQLSAMFDGELPAHECELLSRRIDRDERLRARWSRYALIGAAMRSEPVATAPSGFARRVSAALRAPQDGRRRRPRANRRLLLTTAMAASMVVGVAGLSISMLREVALVAGNGPAAAADGATGPAAPAAVVDRRGRPVSGATLASIAAASAAAAGRSEPLSYVTPASAVSGNTALRTDLADFIVAHSQYSMPLMRRNLLSALVSNEDGSVVAAPALPATDPAVAGAPGAGPAAGALHAVTAAPAAGR